MATVAVAMAAVAALVPASAFAGYPGSNGKIAFERAGQIWTMNLDGTGQVQLTTAAQASIEPQWSPNGQRILYRRGSDVRVMNADGGGDVLVESGAHSPTWSPDGSRVAWVRDGSHPIGWLFADLFDSSLEGAQERHVAHSEHVDDPFAAGFFDSEWSPRGDRIAMTEVLGPDWTAIALSRTETDGGKSYMTDFFTGNTSASEPAWSPTATHVAYLEQTRDTETEAFGPRQIWSSAGSESMQLTTDASDKEYVEWSPDGSKLLFSKGGDLWLMNPNGTGQTQVTTTPGTERDPDWQPVVPAPPPAGYIRPKSAGLLRFALVPAYNSCTSANRQHGPPLAFPSCAPPVQTSAALTTGTPDANGAVANMVGLLELRSILGDAATPVDEADVLLKANITDVRCTSSGCGQSNTIGPADEVGFVFAHLSLRITDRYNLPAPGGRLSGTTTQIPLRWPIDCTATADTTVGGICASHTTLDALAGGTIIEGRRANIELSQAEVGRDTGPGFLRQGVFVP